MLNKGLNDPFGHWHPRRCQGLRSLPQIQLPAIEPGRQQTVGQAVAFLPSVCETQLYSWLQFLAQLSHNSCGQLRSKSVDECLSLYHSLALSLSFAIQRNKTTVKERLALCHSVLMCDAWDTASHRRVPASSLSDTLLHIWLPAYVPQKQRMIVKLFESLLLM